MIVDGMLFFADLSEILTELTKQLSINHIPYLQTIRDTPDNIMVSCPYHKNGQERKPSAGIKKDSGIFHCFACGETHTLPEMISYCFGNDMLGSFGWSWLLKNFATVTVEDRQPLELDFERHFTNNQYKYDYVSEEELDIYREYHPYMWKRKMTPEVVELFDVGYDKKTDCITFPVRDIQGRCLFIARRSVKTKFFNYPQGVTKPIYGLYELYQQDEMPQSLIVCESMIDAITCYVYGKPAVAMNGLGNNLQFHQLRQLPVRHLILATDNDSAGQSARQKIVKNVPGKLYTEFIFPNNRKDINDLSKDEFDSLSEKFYSPIVK